MSLSKSIALSLRALATARILVGSSTLLLPSQSAWIFGLSPSISAAASAPGLSALARLFGVRDMVMGGYLWTSLSGLESSTSKTRNIGATDGKVATAESEPLSSHGRTGHVASDEVERYSATRQLRHAIWLGLICDSVDVFGGLACFLESGMGWQAIVLVYGGAALFASIGIAGVRAMREL